MNPLQKDLEDLEYWKEFTDIFGWRVMGWTYRSSALIEVGPNQTLELTRTVRDAIVNKVTALQNRVDSVNYWNEGSFK